MYSKLSEVRVDEAGYQTRVDSVDSRDLGASEQKEGYYRKKKEDSRFISYGFRLDHLNMTILKNMKVGLN